MLYKCKVINNSTKHFNFVAQNIIMMFWKYHKYIISSWPKEPLPRAAGSSSPVLVWVRRRSQNSVQTSPWMWESVRSRLILGPAWYSFNLIWLRLFGSENVFFLLTTHTHYFVSISSYIVLCLKGINRVSRTFLYWHCISIGYSIPGHSIWKRMPWGAADMHSCGKVYGPAWYSVPPDTRSI
jgi:hypothetical protein